MSAVDPFARVPHRFTDALRRREVTMRQYGLATYIVATADFRIGRLSRTLAVLADECGYPSPAASDMLARDLAALERLGWIRQRVVQGQRRPRTIKLTGLLPTSTSARLPQDFRTEDPDFAEVTSARAAPTTQASTQDSADSDAYPLPHGASPQEVEVDVEHPPNPPLGGLRKRRNVERRIARFARELSGEFLASFGGLTADAQAEVVDRHSASTGLRLARGSGGISYRNDALGDYPRPTGSEALQLPPDYAGRATPADFLRAWLGRRGEA